MQDELPEALLELLLTPEKDELLAEGKGMFAVLEYIGYGDAAGRPVRGKDAAL